MRLKSQNIWLDYLEKVEKFITHMLVSKDIVFDLEIEDFNKDQKMENRKVEEPFFNFNNMFKGQKIRGIRPESAFSSNIQYSADIELFINYFENKYFCIHTPRQRMLPVYRREELLRRAVPAQSYDLKFPDVYSEIISTGELTRQDKKKLYAVSDHFFGDIHSLEHMKILNMIDSNCLNRYKGACVYVNNLFEEHKHLFFVALDLCFDPSMKFEQQQRSLIEFKNRIRQAADFSDLIGFLGKWEFSLIKDTYIRMIFIFQRVEKHFLEQLPELIGGYWKNVIMDGKGTFHFAYLANGKTKLNATTCMISDNQYKLRNELEQRTIFYLTYSQEYYRYKYNISSPSHKRYEPAFKKNKKKEEVESTKEEKSKFIIQYTEPRDIFFRGELTGRLLEESRHLREERAKRRELKKH